MFTPSFNHLTKLLICIIIKYRSSIPPTSTGSQGVSYRCDHLFLFLYFSSWLCNRMCGGNQRYSNKQTNVFVKPRTSPFTGGHSSHALRLGLLSGARRTQMRSSALGVLPQCPRGLMLDCARHTVVVKWHI